MGKFLESEKSKQASFKVASSSFSDSARGPGEYKGKLYSFCLPADCARQNLFPEIRATMPAYFNRKRIKWHDGRSGNPSNHLCSSQVCCANFLFPFSDKPKALAELFRPLYPKLQEPLQFEDGLYIAFEWIGKENYLHEGNPRTTNRTRGANYTSADAAIKYKKIDGTTQIVLIEWKYTESYSENFLKTAKSGKDRPSIYYDIFMENDCPINKEVLPDFESLFYEPFYQLMRQQLLAYKMETAGQPEADIVSLLHISPKHNTDFKQVTSPRLNHLGSSPVDIWRKLVGRERFISISTEELFNAFDESKFPSLSDWKAYIHNRYSWLSS